MKNLMYQVLIRKIRENIWKVIDVKPGGQTPKVGAAATLRRRYSTSPGSAFWPCQPDVVSLRTTVLVLLKGTEK